ncbi:hypothetical protein L5515_019508 [Caenorhabditis briggsae]|uniref:Uncharacterized protein n=1 Tax=Caenorhabditis briggsae TaxID=6238 RepID=A0AAE9JTU9_CAEBR|nr:hypothetical protein L5515_019508 [Caenorhabditis briggsae]
MAYGRKPIDIEDSFDYSSDERSSSPLATRLSEARQGVRDMIAKWNAQECARTAPPPAQYTCETSTSSTEPRQTVRQSISSTAQQFQKNTESEFDAFFKKLRSHHKFLKIVSENLPIFLEKELPKKARKNVEIEQLVKALKGVRSVFEIFDSHKTKDVSQLVIRVGSFVKTCLHALSIAVRVNREVETRREKDEKLGEVLKKFEVQHFMTPYGPSNILSELFTMQQDLEGCGPILRKVMEKIHEEHEKKKLAQEAIQKVENYGSPNADSQKDLQLKMKAVLHKKFQGKLNVYKNARYFIKEGPVKKQSRNKKQTRHLVLFTDLLCVCRLERSWKSKNFNVKKSYFLDINEIQISPDTPEDGEVLEILSAVKSFSFYFEKKEEKTTWENAIRHSQEQASKRIGRKNLEQHMDLKLLKPIQVPKADVTECMIEGCGSSFTMLSKRRSCKNCGIAICSRCVGRAPLANTKYNQGNVCPDCYDKILEDCDAGTLFPDSITDVTKGKLRVKIGKKLRNPSSLFKKPQNFGLKKKNYEERKTDKIAADYVYIRDAKGAEKLRFVYIRKSDYTLRVFKSKSKGTQMGDAKDKNVIMSITIKQEPKLEILFPKSFKKITMKFRAVNHMNFSHFSINPENCEKSMIYCPKRDELLFEAKTLEKCQEACESHEVGGCKYENEEKAASIFELLVSSKVQFKCFVWRFCPLGFETLADIVRGDRNIEMKTSELTKEDIANLIAIWVDYGVVRNFKVSGMNGVSLCDLIKYTHWPMCTKNNNKSVDVVLKDHVAARIELSREEFKITPLHKYR